MDRTSMTLEEKHLQDAHWTRLRRGGLTPGEVIAVTTHVANCDSCREAGPAQLGSSTEGVLDQILRDSSNDHPDAESTLVRFVDGELPSDEHELVDAHLGICDRCRTDVDDLRAVAASMRQPRRDPRWWWIAVAAILAVVTTSILLLRPDRDPRPHATPPPIARPTPPPTPPVDTATLPLKSEWQALIAETIRSGRIPAPKLLRDIQVSPERVRGTAVARTDAVSPAEEVLEADRPRFTWPAAAGATAVVFVYRGDDEIVVSEPLRGNTWTPSKPLPRGVPLLWQVELRAKDGSTRVVPSPPDPPAIFRVVDETSRREIAEASRLQPPNDLLLGTLYARAGLKRRAIEALRRHASTHPETLPLLRSVEDWP